MALFAVAIPALLLERKGVGGALSRSIELTKGHFWHVLGVVLSCRADRLPLECRSRPGSTSLPRSASPTTLVLAQGVANAVASILTTPFVAAATVALYFDLRIRDEAFDVQMAMANTQSAR